MFPLCHLCADTLAQIDCQHEDEERAFIGTWISEELKLAIEKEFKILKVFFLFFFLGIKRI